MSWDNAKLGRAAQALEDGVSLADVSRRFGVRPATLRGLMLVHMGEDEYREVMAGRRGRKLGQRIERKLRLVG